jgi:hypothetical protein
MKESKAAKDLRVDLEEAEDDPEEDLMGPLIPSKRNSRVEHEDSQQRRGSFVGASLTGQEGFIGAIRWWMIMIMCLSGLLPVIFLFGQVKYENHSYPQLFQCPAEQSLPDNVKEFEKTFERDYGVHSKTLNMTEYVNSF